MATFGTLNPTSSTTSTDDYLLRQGGVDYKQSREHLAAGIANARWDATATYDVGSEILGSDDKRYVALFQTTGTDPTTDDGTTWEQLYYKKDVSDLDAIADLTEDGFTFFSFDQDATGAPSGTYDAVGLQMSQGGVEDGQVTQLVSSSPEKGGVLRVRAKDSTGGGFGDWRTVATYKSGDTSFTANGYSTLPNGLIFQWGTVATSGGNGTVTATFPISFTTAVFGVFGNTQLDNANATFETIGSLTSASGSSITTASGGSNTNTVDGVNVNWIAIGY
jgi:hypothetical protein